MTVIERAEKTVERTEGSVHHVEALIAALGNPSEWEYTGDVTDAGTYGVAKCACGHPIRFQFHIEHPDGRKAIVGSTCVNHFATINPTLHAALVEALEGVKAKLAADKRAAREAKQDEEIARLKAECDALAAPIRERYRVARENSHNGYWVPEDIFYANRAARQEPKQYKRKSDYLRWYREHLETLRRYSE